MLRISFILLFFGGLLAATSDQSVPEQDTYIEIEDLYDSNGLPEGYKAYIKTAVCESENCYIVQIHFFWDLIGRFQRFDTLPGEGLTKLDHIPFTDLDYQKLDVLLKDENSPLANYSKEDLVRDTRSSEIDGFTGATIQEIKERVISGGVYSCHTLWHIAHGEVIDSLQVRTYAALDSALVEQIISQQDQAMNYFLIQYFSDQDLLTYLPQFLKTFTQSSGYYAKNALERMPSTAVCDPLSQAFFARHFNHLNYFAQVALLKKLNRDTLLPALAKILEQALDERSSARNALIKDLIDG